MLDPLHTRGQVQYIVRALVVLLYRGAPRIAKGRHAPEDLELGQRRKQLDPLALFPSYAHTPSASTDKRIYWHDSRTECRGIGVMGVYSYQ